MSVFDDRPCTLGEGALWHPERRQFFWFDILEQRLMSREADGTQRDWPLGRMASAAGWIDADRLMIGTDTGLAILDLRDASLEEVAAIEADDPRSRSNDGRADRQGGFWISTMARSGPKGNGAIYRYHRGEVRRLVSGLATPNAICFSPDGGFAHYTDGASKVIWRLRLDAEGWPVGEAQRFLDCGALGVKPDGAVIDAAGAFCVAHWGGGEVVRFGSDGALLDRVAVGGIHSSCPALGGAEMRHMLVTTALEGLDDPAPGDGLTYLVAAPAPGLPEPRVIL